MNRTVPSLPERLARNRYRPDDESHIEVQTQPENAAEVGRILTAVCAAHVYSLREDGTIAVAYEACLECGTCLAVAPPGSLHWHYPRGGTGVSFREG